MSNVSLVRMFGITLPDPWEKGTEEQQKAAYKFMQMCGWEVRKSMLTGPDMVSFGIVVEEMEALLDTSPYKNAPIQVAYTGDVEEGITWTHIIVQESETVLLRPEDPGVVGFGEEFYTIDALDHLGDTRDILEEIGRVLYLEDPYPHATYALRKGSA